MPITLEKKDEVLVLRKKSKPSSNSTRPLPSQRKVRNWRCQRPAQQARTLCSHSQAKATSWSPGMLKGDESHPHSVLGYCPRDPRAEERRPRCEQGVVHTKILRLSFDCPHPVIKTRACKNAFSSLNTKGN